MWYLAKRAFAFGGVKHPELSPFLTWWPIIFAFLAGGLFIALPVKPKLTGDGSLSRHLITVFSVLPGFYIAALAAVATFNRVELDFIMPEPTPEIRLRTGSHAGYVKVTFRLFISHLFSFLVVLSFITVFACVGAELVEGSVKLLVDRIQDTGVRQSVVIATQTLFCALIAWLSAKLILTTLVGLYFLAERIHRPEV